MHASARLGGHDTIPGALLESRVFRLSRMREYYARSLVIAEIRDYLQSVWKCIFAYHLQCLKMTTKTKSTPNENARIRRRWTQRNNKKRAFAIPAVETKHRFSMFNLREIYFLMFSVNSFFYTESWTGGSKLSRSIFAPVSSVVVCVVPSPCNSINLLTGKKMTPVIEHQGVITNLF